METDLPFVGRERELTALRERLDALSGGRGGLLLLTGEAGAGKSALLSAALRGAAGLTAVTGRCQGPGETPALGPWVEIFAGVPAGAPRLPQPLGSGERAVSLPELAGRLAEWLASRGRPVAAALEEIQWADLDSLELLRLTAPRLRQLPVLLIATCRSDELHRTHPVSALLPELERNGAAVLPVGPLTLDSVGALVAAALPNRPDGLVLASQIHCRSGGNALLVRELLEAAAHPDGRGTELPETIRQAVLLRLRRAGAAAQQLMQAAAVIGERFDPDLLRRVVCLSEAEVEAGLTDSAGLRLIRVDGAAGRCRFDHALVRDALLDGMNGLKRRCWHRAVGEALLSREGVSPEAVALHLARAGDPRAAEHLLGAAVQCFRFGARRTAEALLEQVLERLPARDPRRGEALLRLGVVLSDDQECKRLECAEEAEAAAEAVGDEVIAALARCVRQAAAIRRGELRCEDLLRSGEMAKLRDEVRCRRLLAELFGERSG